MTVRELIEFLKTKPQEFNVILSKDAEGNGYSPLADLSEEMYEPISTWSGNVVCEEDIQDEDFEFQLNAIVLHPVN